MYKITLHLFYIPLLPLSFAPLFLVSGSLFEHSKMFSPKATVNFYSGTGAAEFMPRPQVCPVGTDSQPLSSALVCSRAVPHQLVVTPHCPHLTHKHKCRHTTNCNICAFMHTGHMLSCRPHNKNTQHSRSTLRSDTRPLLQTRFHIDNNIMFKTGCFQRNGWFPEPWMHALFWTH